MDRYVLPGLAGAELLCCTTRLVRDGGDRQFAALTRKTIKGCAAELIGDGGRHTGSGARRLICVAEASQRDSGLPEQFAANRTSMMTFVERLRALETRAKKASSKRQATFEKRGQLIPSDRLNRLLDPGMPFLRLHTLANFGVDNPDQENQYSRCLGLGGYWFCGWRALHDLGG